MDNADLIFHHISDWGFTHDIALRTKRGLHVGRFSSNHHAHATIEDCAKTVPRWHWVPRWMTPREVLNAFEA